MSASLASSKLIACLSSPEIQNLNTRCAWRDFDAGYTILELGQHDTSVYFVVKGAVRVVIYSLSGKEIGFREVGAGGHVGELAAIDGKPRSATIVAVVRSTVAIMPANLFLEVLSGHPDISLAVLKDMAANIRALSERVVEFTTLKVRHRIHAELLRLAGDRIRDNVAVISPPPLHAALASRVSTHREAVTKELSELTRSGVLSRRRGALQINDVTRLREMIEISASTL